MAVIASPLGLFDRRDELDATRIIEGLAEKTDIGADRKARRHLTRNADGHHRREARGGGIGRVAAHPEQAAVLVLAKAERDP